MAEISKKSVMVQCDVCCDESVHRSKEDILGKVAKIEPIFETKEFTQHRSTEKILFDFHQNPMRQRFKELLVMVGAGGHSGYP